MDVEYGGWKHCRRLANDEIELIATTEVGPRIIRLGFIGEPNVFGENAEDAGQTGGDVWRIYGGHRLWHAPEDHLRTYWPDNVPVRVEAGSDSLILTQEIEPTTGIEKTIELRLWPHDNRVTVVHRLRNRGLWPIETAPWALSVMTRNGFAIVPQPPADVPQETAVAPMAYWTYTDMSDPRWRWGRRYVTLRQDPCGVGPQKIGLGCPDGWLAYAVGGYLFVSLFGYQDGATYPDYGSSVEIYTSPEILEVETLGPLTRLEPGQSIEHKEDWLLFRGVPVTNDDDSIGAEVLPRIEAARAPSSR
jgi:hypothetical protein